MGGDLSWQMCQNIVFKCIAYILCSIYNFVVWDYTNTMAHDCMSNTTPTQVLLSICDAKICVINSFDVPVSSLSMVRISPSRSFPCHLSLNRITFVAPLAPRWAPCCKQLYFVELFTYLFLAIYRVSTFERVS